MSRGKSAFNPVRASNLPSGIFQLRQSEVSEAASLSSSKQSSIPELSKAEELALKRTSSEFAPIGQIDELGSSATLRPSADLMQSLDRASGPRRTSEWDEDELEVSQQSSNPPVDIIPSHVRGSTPDSVVSSGRFVLGGSHGERRPLDAGHLQENVVHKTNYNLHKSMREQISKFDDARPSTSTADIEVEMRSSRATDERAGPFDQLTFKPEEKRSFWPRCSLLLLAVMIVLAGVIALVVRFKDDTHGKRGKVLPNKITHQECNSETFNLGDELNFTCIFDANHAYRNRIAESTKVEVIPKDRISTEIYTMNVTVGTKGTSRHEILVKGDSKAKCSSAGTYDVIFRDTNGTVTAHVNVTFTMKESTLVTSMNQRQLKGSSNCLETMFDVTCNIHNDCNNYHTTIYKNKFGNVQNLNSYLECTRNFTDDDGYMIDCSGSLPDNLVESYSFLACKMEAKRPDNRVVKKEQRYTLPNCGVETRCHTREPGYAVFNCSEKAADYLNLQKAVCSFPKQSNCLKPGRHVFGMYKDRFDNLTCSTENTVPVCRLSWCSDYRFIRKNEIPGVVICSPSFNERYVSPTTTSTTIRTSEGTSPTTSSNLK